MKKQLYRITLLGSLIAITQSHATIKTLSPQQAYNEARTRSERAQAGKVLIWQVTTNILAEINGVKAKTSQQPADVSWLNDAQQKLTIVCNGVFAEYINKQELDEQGISYQAQNIDNVTDADIQTLLELRLAGSKLLPHPNRFLQ